MVKPERPVRVVGIIEGQGNAFGSLDRVLQDVKAQACKAGAGAVILEYAGRPVTNNVLSPGSYNLTTGAIYPVQSIPIRNPRVTGYAVIYTGP